MHVGFEYLSFMALLTCLYVCSGGIVVGMGGKGRPWSNTLLLLVGGLIANLVGTTGASMLLISLAESGPICGATGRLSVSLTP